MKRTRNQTSKKNKTRDDNETTFVDLFPELFADDPEVPEFKRPRRPRSRPLAFEETLDAYFLDSPKPKGES